MNDQELIVETLQGKTDCFEQLVFRYEKPLMRFLNLRCYSTQDAEDIFQETFINVHKYLSSYDDKYSFSTWVFNVAINLLKKQIGHLNLANQEEQFEGVYQQDFKLPADNIWHTAREKLNEDQFYLLWFTYVEGLSGNEVAKVIDKSLPWVKINLIRSKQALKKCLAVNDVKSAVG